MNCDAAYYGFGNYWHWGNLILTILIIAVIVWVIYHLTANLSYRHPNGSSFFNNFVSVNKKDARCPKCSGEIEESFLRCPECNYKLKDNCPSCGKIVKTSWNVCPYCETKLK
jgi:DNA-directed RNA polymerase subunit RPC12/RpoP